jgi:hypothetical protein
MLIKKGRFGKLGLGHHLIAHWYNMFAAIRHLLFAQRGFSDIFNQDQ